MCLIASSLSTELMFALEVWDLLCQREDHLFHKEVLPIKMAVLRL